MNNNKKIKENKKEKFVLKMLCTNKENKERRVLLLEDVIQRQRETNATQPWFCLFLLSQKRKAIDIRIEKGWTNVVRKSLKHIRVEATVKKSLIASEHVKFQGGNFQWKEGNMSNN